MLTLTNCPNCGAPVDPGFDRCAYCGTPYQAQKKNQPLFPLEIECPVCRNRFEGTADNVGWSFERGPDMPVLLGLNYVCPHCYNRIESETYLTPGKKKIDASDLISVNATHGDRWG